MVYAPSTTIIQPENSVGGMPPYFESRLTNQQQALDEMRRGIHEQFQDIQHELAAQAINNRELQRIAQAVAKAEGRAMSEMGSAAHPASPMSMSSANAEISSVGSVGGSFPSVNGSFNGGGVPSSSSSSSGDAPSAGSGVYPQQSQHSSVASGATGLSGGGSHSVVQPVGGAGSSVGRLPSNSEEDGLALSGASGVGNGGGAGSVGSAPNASSVGSAPIVIVPLPEISSGSSMNTGASGVAGLPAEQQIYGEPSSSTSMGSSVSAGIAPQVEAYEQLAPAAPAAQPPNNPANNNDEDHPYFQALNLWDRYREIYAGAERRAVSTQLRALASANNIPNHHHLIGIVDILRQQLQDEMDNVGGDDSV
jgi:hypothetical protein